MNQRVRHYCKVVLFNKIRLIAVCCAALLILASGRGITPSLCANMTALNEVQDADTPVCVVQAGGKTCCQSAPTNKTNQEPERKTCPLCSLVKGVFIPLEYVQFTVPPQENYTPRASSWRATAQHNYDPAAPNRAPPA